MFARTALIVLAFHNCIFAAEPPPLSPEESLKSIYVPAGFEVKLAAAEPLIADPVAIDWDAEGRLWVVEMADYPLGMDGKGKSGGRVRVLQDANGDGRYEKSVLFADGLKFPTGIITWRDGVIITAAPDILFLKDTDGDGRADSREVLFTGFSEGNQQLRINGLRWGLDNWVYCAAGAHHRGYGSKTTIKSVRTGKEIALGSRDFRFKPDTGEFEPQSGPAQFGRNRDEWGRWFGTQNSHPLWQYLLPDEYLRRNPHVSAPDPNRQIFVPANPRVFPVSSSEKRFHSFEHEGHFTSACSGMIYGDQLLFGPGRSHAFVCEPFHNLVQHQILEPDGISFKARRGELGSPPRDFFASLDRWSRPVMVRTGPDGALWVVDMYRLVIEHPDWLPEPGRSELLLKYRLGDDRGRIYRVLPKAAASKKIPSLAGLSSRELIEQFESDNSWIRDKTQQMLLWRGDKSLVEPLEKIARTSSKPLARLHALYTLSGFDSLKPEVLLPALAHAEPGLRENALRLAERFQQEAIQRSAAALARDPDPKVRFQLAFSLGCWNSPDAAKALVRLALHEYSDPYFTAAIMSSAMPHLHELVLVLLDSSPARTALFEPMVLTLVGAGETNLLSQFVGPAMHNLREYSMLLKIARSRSIDPEKFGDASALIRSAETVIDSGTTRERIEAASVLVRQKPPRPRAMTKVAQWLDASTVPDLQRAAVDLLAETGEPTVPDLLLKSWAGYSPQIRALIFQTLLRRETWALSLLERIEPAAFDAVTRAQLRQHSSRKVRDAAARLFSATSPRAEVVAAFRPALELKGDSARGAEIFQHLCLVCHQLDGLGGRAGPDLRTVASHPAEKLLVSILDPNADIQPGYHAYTCVLKNGEELYGVIASETANSLIFRLPTGAEQTISRQEIASLRASTTSLMPEGLENEMTAQELADLISFLREGKSAGP